MNCSAVAVWVAIVTSYNPGLVKEMGGERFLIGCFENRAICRRAIDLHMARRIHGFSCLNRNRLTGKIIPGSIRPIPFPKN